MKKIILFLAIVSLISIPFLFGRPLSVIFSYYFGIGFGMLNIILIAHSMEKLVKMSSYSNSYTALFLGRYFLFALILYLFFQWKSMQAMAFLMGFTLSLFGGGLLYLTGLIRMIQQEDDGNVRIG